MPFEYLMRMGITKEQLSKISGVSTSLISDLTNGKGNPSLRIMERIADALDEPLPACSPHKKTRLENTCPPSAGEDFKGLPHSCAVSTFQSIRL